MGVRSSDLLLEEKDVFVWYRATENDEKVPWNRRDAWRMNHFSATLGTEMVHFLTGPAGIKGSMGGTLLLRVGVPFFDVVFGTYLPGGDLVIGFAVARELAIPLYDFGLPDVQVGLVFLDPGARYVGNTSGIDTLEITTVSPGLRVVCCDLIKADARLGIPQIWLGFDDEIKPAVSWGFALDAGVIF